MGRRLQASLKRAMESAPGLPTRPQELARTLKLNKDFSSRLCSMLRAEDPLASLSMAPGPVPLKQFLKSLVGFGGNKKLSEAAAVTVQEFEKLIETEFDDRAGLNAMLGNVVPETRRKQELAAKQAVFRGMEAIKGVSCEVSLVSFLVHPSMEDEQRTHNIMLGGYFGLRRIRPDAPVQFTSELMPMTQTAEFRARIGLVSDESHLLSAYCRPRKIDIVRTVQKNLANYEFGGNAIGKSSAVDVVLMEAYPFAMTTGQSPAGGRVRYFDATIELPSKRLILDVLVHGSLWNEGRFELKQFDTSIRGLVDLSPGKFMPEAMEIGETIENLGSGIDRMRSSKVPNYVELLTDVSSRLMWKGEEFRGYRCEIAYPMYGSQVCLIYRPPA